MTPLTTSAGDRFRARKAGKRLTEHLLRCTLCNEPSEAEVCGDCIEHQLQSEVHQ